VGREFGRGHSDNLNYQLNTTTEGLLYNVRYQRSASNDTFYSASSNIILL
jgi:hypothetical protein